MTDEADEGSITKSLHSEGTKTREKNRVSLLVKLEKKKFLRDWSVYLYGKTSTNVQ